MLSCKRNIRKVVASIFIGVAICCLSGVAGLKFRTEADDVVRRSQIQNTALFTHTSGLTKPSFVVAVARHVRESFQYLDQQAEGGARILIPGYFNQPFNDQNQPNNPRNGVNDPMGAHGHQLGYGLASMQMSGNTWIIMKNSQKNMEKIQLF